MTLEMRELRGSDTFRLLSIVGKLGVKDDFVRLFTGEGSNKVVPMDHQKKKPTKADKEKQEAEVERRGMEFVAGLIEKVMINAQLIKDDLNALLADLTGKSRKDIDELPLKDYLGLVTAFFTKPELQEAFSSLASVMKSENTD